MLKDLVRVDITLVSPEGVPLHLYGVLVANLPDEGHTVLTVIVSRHGDPAHSLLVFLLDIGELKLTIVELAAVSYTYQSISKVGLLTGYEHRCKMLLNLLHHDERRMGFMIIALYKNVNDSK